MTIKELRTASKMTQKAFAEYFGIPKRNIEDWESGRAECRPYLLNLMAYKLEKEGLAVMPIELDEIDNVRRMADIIME